MTDVLRRNKPERLSPVARWLRSKLTSISLSRKVVADLMAVLEVILVLLAALVAKFLYVTLFLGVLQSNWPYFVIGDFGAVLSYFALKQRGLYQSNTIIEMTGHIPRILFGLATAFLVLIAIAYFLKIANVYSRGWVVVWFVLSFTTLSIERKLVVYGLRKLAKGGAFSQTIAIFGAGPIGQQLMEYFNRDDIDTRLVGIFGDGHPSAHHTVPDIEVAGNLDDLIKMAREKHLDKIIIALPPSQEQRILEAREALEVLPVDIHLCPDLINLSLRCPSVTYIGNLNLLDIHHKPMSEWGRFSKAVLDYVGAAVLLTTLAPLILIIAIAIKLEGRGSVFFRQRRHGFNNSVFYVLKFRTMVASDDGDIIKQATKNDARVTPIGRFLRRTSLDELPQLWNVLRGGDVAGRPKTACRHTQ